MKFPLTQLSSTGASLVEISSRMATLAAEASGINSSIAGCYEQGGVGGRAGAVSSKMYSQASAVSHLGQVSSDAVKSYMTAEDIIGVLVYSRSGDVYARISENDATTSDTIFKGPYGYVVQNGIDKLKGIASNIKDTYNQHGTLYDVVEYGKCALRVGKAVVKISGSVAAIISLVGIPIAIAGIFSAGNDIINAANDAAYVYTDQYHMVGKTNLLKDTLVSNAGDFGEMMGNREAGELFGELTYHGLDLVSLLDGTDKMLKSFGKVNTDLCGPKNSFVWGEAHWDDVLDSEYKHLNIPSLLTDTKTFTDEFIRKNILHIDSASTGHFVIEAIKNTVSVYKKGSSFVEKTIGILMN